MGVGRGFQEGVEERGVCDEGEKFVVIIEVVEDGGGMGILKVRPDVFMVEEEVKGFVG